MKNKLHFPALTLFPALFRSLSLFLILFLPIGGIFVQAQTYTTGVVNLSSTAGLAMTAKMDIGTQVTLTLTGPSGRWFALGFNATGMGSGIDVVTVNAAGTLSSFDARINGPSAPTPDPQQNWTIVSDAVASGVRTVVATRALSTGDVSDYIFTAATGSLSLIWARAQNATFAYSYHGNSNRGVSTANFTLVPQPPAAPSGSASQTLCAGALLSQLSATGTSIQWYANPTGGTPLNGSTVLTSGLTYYATQTVSGVESTNRLAVAVTLNTAPTAPTGITGAAHFCYDVSESYSIAPVNGATSYVWTTPNGSTGSSNGTTLNLLFSPSFVSGTMSVVAQNTCGQSPAVVLNINQHLPYANTLDISSCGPYNFNGQTYSQTGTFPFQGTTVWGCDSTVVLNLTIVQAFTTNVSESACGSFNWNGQSYWQSGSYIDSLQSTSGCDSIVNLNLTINPITSTLIDSTVFDVFTWNGQVYTTSALHTQYFTSIYGCDSVVTIDLIIQDSGLNELEESFVAYPNPINGNQTLFISGITSGIFRVFDLNGSELRSGSFTSQIDLQGIQPGMYYILIGSQRKRITIVG
jgi:hypothetical protein